LVRTRTKLQETRCLARLADRSYSIDTRRVRSAPSSARTVSEVGRRLQSLVGAPAGRSTLPPPPSPPSPACAGRPLEVSRRRYAAAPLAGEKCAGRVSRRLGSKAGKGGEAGAVDGARRRTDRYARASSRRHIVEQQQQPAMSGLLRSL